MTEVHGEVTLAAGNTERYSLAAGRYNCGPSATTRVYEVWTPSGYSGDGLGYITETLVRVGVRNQSFVIGLMRLAEDAAGDEWTVVEVTTNREGHEALRENEVMIDRGLTDLETFQWLQGH